MRRHILPAELTEKHVVTCFLESDGEILILILRRSRKVGSYRGHWAGVSGYVESTPDEQTYIELFEETGLGQEDLVLCQKGEPLQVEDEQLGTRWIVHPYLFHVIDREKIQTDWEHVETRWISPLDIGEYTTVPRLQETLERVYPPLKK